MIRELRDQLHTDLSGAVVLHGYTVPVAKSWPDRISPPMLFLVPPSGGSYVGAGRAFGEYLVSLDVVALVARGSPEVALETLEVLVEKVLLNSQDWALSGVDSPSVLAVNGAEHLGTLIHLAKPARL